MPNDHRTIFRRLLRFQFSLQTLLALTLVAAVAFAWFLAPTFEDETWGGGALRIRAELSVTEQTPGGSPGEAGQIQRDGRWILYDRYARKLVDGYYRADRPIGRWTHFDRTGHRALEGQLLRELPVGEWTARNFNGRLSRRVTYAHRERCRRVAHVAPPSSPGSPAKIEVVSEVSWKPVRDGLAQVYWENGVTRAHGQFVADKRHGKWTFFDRDGNKIAEGPYRDGYKYGVWHCWKKPHAEPTIEFYVRGQAVKHHLAALQRLERDLLGDDRRLQILAARDLELFGESGVAGLRRALTASDPQRRLLAIRSLQHGGPRAAAAGADLARACEDENLRVQLAAMMALAEVEPPRAEGLYRRLLDDLTNKKSAGDQPLLCALRRTGPAGLEQLAASIDRPGTTDRHLAVVDLLLILYEDRREQTLSVGDPNLTAEAVAAVLEKARGHDDEAVRERADLQVDAPPTGWPSGTTGCIF
jgi:HEAT repeat protein